VYVEAGFEYNDAGATASDDLDGDITAQIWKDGDTVSTSTAFYSRRSCKEIKEYYPEADTGSYFITVYVPASGDTGAHFKREQVVCDMHSKNNAEPAVAPGYTYYPCSDCAETVPYTENSEGDCSSYGLEMVQWTESDAETKEWATKTKFPTFFEGCGENAACGDTKYYLCGTNDAHVTDLSNNLENQHARSITHDKITRAEAGKYVITYHVSDSSNNPECSSPSRTVIVRDTLPPVITLHLKNKLIHMSAASENNPAGSSENPHLADDYQTNEKTENSFMAEQTSSSVNGWVIGAIASSVTGLALLSFSLKKAPTTVEV